MSYYTYENWRARGHKANVHIGSCRFCNNGKGLIRSRKIGHRDKWKGCSSTAM